MHEPGTLNHRKTYHSGLAQTRKCDNPQMTRLWTFMCARVLHLGHHSAKSQPFHVACAGKVNHEAHESTRLVSIDSWILSACRAHPQPNRWLWRSESHQVACPAVLHMLARVQTSARRLWQPLRTFGGLKRSWLRSAGVAEHARSQNVLLLTKQVRTIAGDTSPSAELGPHGRLPQAAAAWLLWADPAPAASEGPHRPRTHPVGTILAQEP